MRFFGSRPTRRDLDGIRGLIDTGDDANEK
jgi:hypothetical protein